MMTRRSRLSGSERARASEVVSVPNSNARARAPPSSPTRSATTRASNLDVAVIEQAQPVQRQRVVDPLDRCRQGSDEACKTARSNHRTGVAELGLDAGDDAVDQAGIAEHDARLHRLHGRATDDA